MKCLNTLFFVCWHIYNLCNTRGGSRRFMHVSGRLAGVVAHIQQNKSSQRLAEQGTPDISTMLAVARRAVAPVERAASAAISTSACSGAAAGIPTGHPGPDAHPWLDYKHPGQPGARNDYRDADKDFGFHLSGAFFERPHLRRYTDYLQGDGKVRQQSAHHCA